MKKNIVLISIIVAVIIGFGYFTLLSSPASETASQLAKEQAELAVENTQNSEDLPEVEPKQGVGTLDSLRLLNEDLECKIMFEPKDNSAKVEGTYFVSEGKMRGDFLTESPDLSGQVLSSMIIDGDNMFIWSEIDGEVYGIKMSVSQVGNSSLPSNEPVSINDDVNYDCVPWKEVDGTVFLPPGSILFRDIDELMRGGMEYGTVYETELPY